MYPVLTKTATKKLILQTGKIMCAHILRSASDISNDIEVSFYRFEEFRNPNPLQTS